MHGHSDAPSDLVDLLAGTSLFGDLDFETLGRVAGELSVRRVGGGETLMQQGDAADGLYLVLSGRLRVFVVGADGAERMVGEIGRGESVGEMAVLSGEPRSASVRAIRDSELVKLSLEAFERLVRARSETFMRLTRTIVRRLNDATHAIHPRRTVATIAVVPAGRQSAPVTEVARELAAALEPIGETLHLTAGRLAESLGAAEGAAVTLAADGAAVRWINEQEARFRFLVYEADPTLTSWTQRCVRQADYVLAVSAAGSDAAPGPVEDWMRAEQHATHAVTDLVLVHEPGTAPHDTRRWLEPRPGQAHHHVRRGHLTDYERVARLVTGRGVGLALGGGGARGYAHVGVVRALRERGIPIDVIGGTSMGAIIAAQVAQGLSADEMAALCQRTFAALPIHKSPTLPLVSLINARRLNRVLHEIAGQLHIEDLWLRYFCVATNLTRAEIELQVRGDLYTAIRSSCSVPGLGPPVIRAGELIVDGGVLNNLPADVARRLTQGTVMASSVAAKEDLRTSLGDADDLSGWAILLNRLNPFARRIDVPLLPAILERTATLASVHAAEAVARQVDLFFSPPVEQFKATQWESLDTMVDIGYRHALTQIADWESRGGRAVRRSMLASRAAPSVVHRTKDFVS